MKERGWANLLAGAVVGFVIGQILVRIIFPQLF